MFWNIDKANPVGNVMQEIRSDFHTFKDACLSFFVQFHVRDTGRPFQPSARPRVLGGNIIIIKPYL